MILSLILLFCTSTVVSSFILQLNFTKLTKDNIQHNWKQTLSKQFPQKKQTAISGIAISETTIDSKGLDQLFEYNLLELKHLNFSNVNLSPQLIPRILQHQLFQNLEILELESCRLHSKDFQKLKKQKVSLKYLHLGGNFIDNQAIKYLSNLQTNLTSLKLSQNYLGHQQIADSIINLGLSNLQYLYLDQSSISQQNLLKILAACNTSNIKNLSIAINNYNVNFYRQFAKMDFSNLKYLDFNALLIDEFGVEELKKARFPQLQEIKMTNNFLRTSEGKLFFTKSIMPKLNNLNLALTPLDGYIFEHLYNQGFVFKRLITDTYVDAPMALEYLSKMNVSKLQFLEVESGLFMKGNVESFLKNSNLESLKTLVFRDNREVGDLFHNLLQINLTNLQKLMIDQTGNIQVQWLDKPEHFPNLKILTLDLKDKTIQFTVSFINSCTTLAPILQQLSIIINQFLFYELYQKLLSGELSSKSKLKVMVNEILQFELQPDSTPKILGFNYQFMRKKYVQELEKAGLQYQELSQRKQQIKSDLVVGLDFSDLKVLLEQKECEFFRLLLQSQFRNFKNKLTRFKVANAKIQCITLLQNYTLPYLGSLELYLSQFFKDSFKNYTLKNLGYLSTVSKLLVVGKDDQTDFVGKLVKNVGFSHLKDLVLNSMPLRDIDLSNITGEIKNLDRIVSLDLKGNALKNMSTINDKMMLKQLYLDGNILGNYIIDLCDLQLRFIKKLYMNSCGISNEDFISFLECKQSKISQVFPNLQYFQLSGNYIDTSGTRKLFEVGLPLLLEFDELNNKDFEYFNTLFGSPYAKRIAFFIWRSEEIESIAADIPKSNVRRLVTLIIESESMRDIDFINLGRLQFMRLKNVGFALKHVGECESLKSIRKLSANIKVFVSLFFSPLPTLNSECLEQNALVNKIRPSIIRYRGPGWYFQTQSFIDSYINPNQYLQAFQLEHYACPSQSKMLKMLNSSDLSNLKIFTIDFCDQITDQVTRNLLDAPMDQLIVLRLSGSEMLTSQGFSLMKDFVYPYLVLLSFKSTGFGDEALEHLITNEFPELKQLDLSNTDITSEKLILFEKLNAPQLKSLDLSCNQIDPDVLMKINFSEQKFPLLQKIILYPTLDAHQAEKIMIFINLNRKEKFIKIVSDFVYLNNQDSEAASNHNNS